MAGRRDTLRGLTLGLALAAVLAAPSHAERRLPVGSDAPPWLHAVGRLAIPTSRVEDGRRRHYDERCSGTLLAPPGGGAAQWVLSAWHCLEYYTDLSRDIRFELTGPAGEPLSSRARAVASGGGMAADWALLELDPPIPPGRGATAELDAGAVAEGARLAMAGFSGDPGLGAGGERLTYDPDCRVTGASGADRLTDCLAYKGASGGGAFHGGRLVGVLSRGDSRGRSIYVPAARFLAAVRLRLR
ncbi:MAG: trypsin-like serine peptidase [Pseudohaliea sp.]